MLKSKKKTTEYRRAFIRRSLAILLCLMLVVGNAPLMGSYAFAEDAAPAATEGAGDQSQSGTGTDTEVPEGGVVEGTEGGEGESLENEIMVLSDYPSQTEEQTADSVVAVGSGSLYTYFSDFEEGLDYAGEQAKEENKEILVKILAGKTVKLTGEAGADPVVVENDVKLIVSSDAKLLLPFKENGEDSDKSSGNGDFETRAAWASVNSGKFLNQSLKVEAGGKLEVEKGGTLTVAGVTGTKADKTAQGQTTGSYSQIINNGTITVNGDMEAYGLVKGSGSMVISSTGKLTEPFYIADFPGGTNMIGAIDEMFPCNEYGMNNIQVPITLYAGGEINGEAKLYVSLGPISTYAGAEMTVVGMDKGIIKLSSGYATIDFEDNDPFHDDLGTLDFDVRGNGSIGVIESKILTYNVSSENKFISIPHNFNLTLEDGNYSINKGVYTKLMPGAKFTIKDGATVTVRNGAKLLAYNGLQMANLGDHRYPTAEQLQGAGYSAAGQLIIDGGTLTIENGGTFAGIVQNTGAGKVVTQAGAKLNLGADGTYYDGAETSTSNNRTYADIDAQYWNGIELVSMPESSTETKVYNAYSGNKEDLKTFTAEGFECTKWHEHSSTANVVDGSFIKYPKGSETRQGAWNIYDVELEDLNGAGYTVTFTGDNQDLLDEGVIQPGQSVTVTITVDKGYTIDEEAADGDNAPKLDVTNAEISEPEYEYSEEDGKSIYTYVISNVSGTLKVDLDSKIADIAAPTGSVHILHGGEIQKSWIGELVEDILEKLHIRSKMDVRIDFADDASGVESVAYIVNDTGIKKAELESYEDEAWADIPSNEWKDSSTGFTFEDAGKLFTDAGITDEGTDGSDLIVYVKIVDVAGNAAYISTAGMRVDNTAPVVKSGGVNVADDTYFYQKYDTVAKRIVVSDKNLDAFRMVDEETGKEVEPDGNAFIIYPKAKRIAYTIYATDLAGNELKGADGKAGISLYYVQPLTVTFESEYGDPQTFSYEYDEEITIPEAPAAGNAKFVGWFTEEGEQLIEGTKASANVTYIAEYDVVYDVTFPDETDAYKVTSDIEEGAYPSGTEFTLEVTNKNSDEYCSFIVKVNEEEIEAAEGVYTVKIADKAVDITVEAVKHDIYSASHVDSTCEEKGYDIYKCENCDVYNAENKKTERELAGHTYEGKTVVVDPTCEKQGTITGVCSVCGDASGVTYIPAKGHEFSVDVESDKNRPATCYQTGIQVKACANENCDAEGGVATKIVYTAKLDHTVAVDAAVPATCSKAGLTEGSHCTVEECGKIIVKQEIIPKLGHQWTVDEEKSDLTFNCEKAGLKVEVCSRDNCGKVKETVLHALGHDWIADEVNSKAATCTSEGKTVEKCQNSGCTETKITVIEPTGHDYKLDKVVTASCTSAGYDKYVCSVCKDVKIENYKNALNHDLVDVEGYDATCYEKGLTDGKRCTLCGSMVVPQEPTDMLDHVFVLSGMIEAECDVDGFATYTCSDKNCTAAKFEVIPAAGHDWGKEVTVQEAKCLTNGIVYKKCNNCNHYETWETDRLGHNWNDVEAKPATCTEDGHEAGRECTRCGDVRGKAVIPAKGHEETVVPGKAATCTQTGLTEGKVCGREECGETLIKQEVIPKADHKYNKVVTKPTCTEGGFTTYTCECGHSYIGDNTDKLGHDYKMQVITEPTCTEAGFTTYTCSCGDSYKGDEVKAKEHDLDKEWQIVEDATCTKDGKRIKGCSACDYYEEEVIPATGHVDKIALEAVAPTCTKNGLTAGEKCACGEILVAQEEVSALGHKEVTVEGKAADCENEGLTEGKKCERCEELLVKQEVIPATGHKWSVVEAESYDPTCTEEGKTVEKCTVCEEHKTTIVKALGHELEYHDGKVATCTKDGYEAYEECTVCDYTTYKVIKSEGHKFVEEVIEGTCTEAGLIIKMCKCGHEETAVGEPAENHKFGDWVETKAPTCTEPGEATRECERCGETETKEIEATGHTYGEEKYQKPTETTDGGTYVECACGDIKWLAKQTWTEYVSEAVKATTIEIKADADLAMETVNIEWTVTGEFDIDGYIVYRADSNDEGAFEVLGQTEAGAFLDATAEPGKTYYYKVVGYKDVAGTKVDTKASNVVSAMIEKVDEDFVKESQMYSTTTYAVRGIQVMWTNPRVKVDGYEIYRSTSKDGTYKLVHTSSTEERTWTDYDKKLKIGKKYYYKVRGYKYVDGEKTNTQFSKRGYRYLLNTKNSKIAMTIEGKDGIIAKEAYKVSGGIKVKWTKYKAVKCTKYKVYRATSENGTYKLIAKTKNKYYTDKSKSLKKGKTYYYKIVGYRVFGKAYPQTNKSEAMSATR